jgi:hypothetical protein
MDYVDQINTGDFVESGSKKAPGIRSKSGGGNNFTSGESFAYGVVFILSAIWLLFVVLYPDPFDIAGVTTNAKPWVPIAFYASSGVATLYGVYHLASAAMKI